MTILVHPKLPDREIDVPDVSVPHYERSGWQRKKKERRAKPVETAELPDSSPTE